MYQICHFAAYKYISNDMTLTQHNQHTKICCSIQQRREEDCKLVNMDINNAGFKILQILALQMRKEMHSMHFLDFMGTHIYVILSHSPLICNILGWEPS